MYNSTCQQSHTFHSYPRYLLFWRQDEMRRASEGVVPYNSLLTRPVFGSTHEARQSATVSALSTKPKMFESRVGRKLFPPLSKNVLYGTTPVNRCSIVRCTVQRDYSNNKINLKRRGKKKGVATGNTLTLPNERVSVATTP